MDRKHLPIVVFWIAMIALPILSSIVAIMQLPQDAQIPMHWNAQGQVDRFASPWAMLLVSSIMAACNSLLAVSYVFIDKLFDYGLVHGISRKASRPFLCGAAVVLLLIWVGILIFWLYQIGNTPI